MFFVNHFRSSVVQAYQRITQSAATALSQASTTKKVALAAGVLGVVGALFYRLSYFQHSNVPASVPADSRMPAQVSDPVPVIPLMIQKSDSAGYSRGTPFMNKLEELINVHKLKDLGTLLGLGHSSLLFDKLIQSGVPVKETRYLSYCLELEANEKSPFRDRFVEFREMAGENRPGVDSFLPTQYGTTASDHMNLMGLEVDACNNLIHVKDPSSVLKNLVNLKKINLAHACYYLYLYETENESAYNLICSLRERIDSRKAARGILLPS